MAEARLDAILVGWPQNVYYLSGFWTGWLHQSAFILMADGRSWLISANVPANDAAADNLVAYEAQWNSTQRSDQPAIVAGTVAQIMRSAAAYRVGIDASLVSSQFGLRTDAALESIDAILVQLRRVKDPDELMLMKKAIACTIAMYQRAREIIEPGIPELTVFGALHAAAVQEAGEPLSALLGNDYQCNSRGGPARKDHRAGEGELYILDLGPCYRGYFSDNARTFAVNRKPTDAQFQACEFIQGVHQIIHRLVKPGASCVYIFEAVDAYYRDNGWNGLPHHLGHGVGLQPHEYPHLNLKWDDTLLEGEVFTAEPGVYSDSLRAGMRIEDQYLVTAGGVEDLVNYPMDL
jgi:Xaa-Pro aminopeptidase